MRPPKPKEKTAREKAMDFAKNVPKPKAKPAQSDATSVKQRNDSEEDFGLRAPEARPETSEFLQMLDQRHQAYSDEVQKIKRTFGFNL